MKLKDLVLSAPPPDFLKALEKQKQQQDELLEQMRKHKRLRNREKGNRTQEPPTQARAQPSSSPAQQMEQVPGAVSLPEPQPAPTDSGIDIKKTRCVQEFYRNPAPGARHL
jgi:hypothetical protein